MVPNRERSWRWSNVPVPPANIIGLVAGFVAHRVAPWSLPSRRLVTRPLGWLLLLGGTAIAVWAVRTVDAIDTTEPDTLVTAGPYAFSRNPMYVAWTLLYTGVSLIANTVWPLVFLPGVAVWTHLVVRGEERELDRAFDDEYRAYADRVPRYW